MKPVKPGAQHMEPRMLTWRSWLLASLAYLCLLLYVMSEASPGDAAGGIPYWQARYLIGVLLAACMPLIVFEERHMNHVGRVLNTKDTRHAHLFMEGH